MTKLADLNLEELNEWLAGKPGIRIPRYLGVQIFRWLGRGAASFDDMTDLSKEIRAYLTKNAVTGIPEIVREQISVRDDTVKYALKTCDGNIVESVLMRYRHGYSVCVSSQAGCKMGCAFCASAPSGFTRSLSAGEMLGQITAITRRENERRSITPMIAAAKGAPAVLNTQAAPRAASHIRVGNVVVMGTGEPFDNYDNTLKFIRLAHEHDDLNLGYRKVTISTCGLVPGILRLAGEAQPIGLSVSLHAPDDVVRKRLMPVANKYSIDKLIEACKIYTEKTKRRVTFEYALIKGVNDSPGDAVALSRLIRNILCHVNLIPINKTERVNFFPSPNILGFAGFLTKNGINVTVRRALGTDILAACGQLRNDVITSKRG